MAELFATPTYKGELVEWLDAHESAWTDILRVKIGALRQGDIIMVGGGFQVSNNPKWSNLRRFNCGIWRAVALTDGQRSIEIGEARGTNVDTRQHHFSFTISEALKVPRDMGEGQVVVRARAAWYKSRRGDRIKVDSDYGNLWVVKL